MQVKPRGILWNTCSTLCCPGITSLALRTQNPTCKNWLICLQGSCAACEARRLESAFSFRTEIFQPSHSSSDSYPETLLSEQFLFQLHKPAQGP